MTKDDIIRMAREATEHLSDVDSVRLQGIVLLALDAGAAHKAEVALAEAYRCGYEAGAVAERERYRCEEDARRTAQGVLTLEVKA